MQMKKTEKDINENKETTKQRKEHAEERILRLARRGLAEAQQKREAKFGRWSPVIDAFELLVHTTLDVAEEEVKGTPRQVAKVQHVRRAAAARLAGTAHEPADTGDVLFTVALLAQLADKQFGDATFSKLVDAVTESIAAAAPF